MQETHNNPYLIPLSIILAGALIGGAVLLRDRENTAVNQAPQGNIQALRLPDGTDHYLGDLEKSQVAVVEYSDTECPFCKEFHSTMLRLMEDPDLKGKIAWVYRHFPGDKLHPKAREEAAATECAAELGGNAGFWNFTNRLYEITPANNGLDLAELPNIAEAVGLNKQAFAKCLGEEKYSEKIQADYLNARETGGTGTPWILVVSKKGSVTPINGSPEFDYAKELILELLEK